MTVINVDRDACVIQITVNDEHIDREQFNEMIDTCTDLIEECGTVRIIERVEQFPRFDLGLIWDDLKFSYENLDRISRCAVVSDSGWVGPYSRLAGLLIPCDIRVFSTDDMQDARDWIYEDANE